MSGSPLALVGGGGGSCDFPKSWGLSFSQYLSRDLLSARHCGEHLNCIQQPCGNTCYYYAHFTDKKAAVEREGRTSQRS